MGGLPSTRKERGGRYAGEGQLGMEIEEETLLMRIEGGGDRAGRWDRVREE